MVRIGERMDQVSSGETGGVAELRLVQKRYVDAIRDTTVTFGTGLP